MVTTATITTQQSVSSIHPNLTTPRSKNPTLPQITLQSAVKPTVSPKYSHMDYQTFGPMTKPTQKQRTFTSNNFAEHNYNYLNRPETSKYFRPNNQNHLFSQNQNFRQPTTTTVNSHDYPRFSQDQSENRFFQQSRNKEQNQNKHNTPNYTPNYQSSDDVYMVFDNIHQEHRQKPPQQNPASRNRNFYPQKLANTQVHQQLQMHNPTNTPSYQPIQRKNPVKTDYYQSTQMQNEIPLPYFLQQHEITKTQLTSFSQMPNAAESLQMTMNPYFMGGSSMQSNKPLMVFTGTDPEHSVEDYLNAVTANLILHIGPEPINTPLHQNWIHRRTALIQSTLDGAAQK